MSFLTIDVGGANLEVLAIANSGTSRWRKNMEGIDVSRAASGKVLITKTYTPTDGWSFTAYLPTVDDLTALRNAAQYPKPISISGDALRTASSGGAPTVTNCTVLVGDADYVAMGDEWYYTAPLEIEKVA